MLIFSWRLIRWIRMAGLAVMIAGYVAGYAPGVGAGICTIAMSLYFSFLKVEEISILAFPDKKEETEDKSDSTEK